MRFFFIILFLLPLFAHAQSKERIASSPLDKLVEEIEKLKKDPDLLHAAWGFCVLSTKSGKIVAEHNSNLSLIPASTLKIITTGAALAILDTSYKYATRLEYDGFIDTLTGVLHGNLYIKGSGDPTLESDYFKSRKGITDKWLQAVQRKGIKKIEGAVIADPSAFEDELIPSTWVWSDMGNYYGSGSCGINYLDNKYTIYFKSGIKTGDPTTIIKVNPDMPFLKLTNYVTTGGNADEAFVYGSPYSYNRYITGTIPAGKSNYEVEGSMPDPAWYCAYALEQKLKSNGVEIAQPSATLREFKMKNEARSLLYTSYSPSIDSIIYFTNLKSDNLYAESLLKTIAFKKDKTGAETSGIEQVKRYWLSKGVNLNGFYMSDGCGLSRMNSITTRQQAEILKIIAREPYYEAFSSSLPVAGKSGSLTSICKNTLAEDNLRAKSGYINKVRGYAGYVKNRSGELFSFSVLANNYECSPSEMKKKMEKLFVLISELD